MTDLKKLAKELGIEPNVTGCEEEMRLEYLCGKRDGFDDAKLETVKNLIELGSDDEFIQKATGLELKTIQKLRND